MMTYKILSDASPLVPMSASWLISDLAEFKGKQELFTRQSPQKLKVLREHAIIESAVSCSIVSVDMIRKILKELDKQGKVRCLGRGAHARWEKVGKAK